MRRFLLIIIMTIIAGVVVGSVNCQTARVTVERITYHGWIDSYRFEAGPYRLTVVPEIGGRIMEYSINGRNVIWENPAENGQTYPITMDWHNYGGYKAWVAPQELWGWPPDPFLDFGKANVEVLQSPKGIPILRLTGCPSLKTGVLFAKEISMSSSGEVTLKQLMYNISGKPVTYSVWGVTQVKTPCFVAFPVKKDSRFPDGISYIMAESRNSRQFTVKDGLCIVRYGGELGKIGADSDGPWMIWFDEDIAYVKLFEPMDAEATYPDGGCSAEVFTSEAKLGYVEMEILGPMVNLSPGESTELTERWRIFKLTQPVTSEDRVVKAVIGMQGKGWIPKGLE